MLKLKTAALALSGAVLALSLSSLASAEEALPSLVVHYNTSQLDTNEGVHQLYSRLLIAAEKVCPQNPGSHLVSEAVVECRHKAIEGAVEKIHNSRLAALSSARSQAG
jgi:UrcA family protein